MFAVISAMNLTVNNQMICPCRASIREYHRTIRMNIIFLAGKGTEVERRCIKVQ